MISFAIPMALPLGAAEDELVTAVTRAGVVEPLEPEPACLAEVEHLADRRDLERVTARPIDEVVPVVHSSALRALERAAGVRQRQVAPHVHPQPRVRED